MTTNTLPHAKHSADPMGTLILHQIAELRLREQLLARRFEAIKGTDEGNAREALRTRVSDLYRRADRLHRMLEEMNHCVSIASSAPPEPVAA